MKRLALLVALAACKPSAPPAAPADGGFLPPAGRRAFSVSLDKSQTQFLEPGDVVELTVMAQDARADGTSESRAEPLAAKAPVLRVDSGWGDDTGLVALALTPEEAQYAALAVEREDRLFLTKLGAEKPALERRGPLGEAPELEKGRRALSVLVYPDQEQFLDPGDRVDVIATRHGYKAAGKGELTAITLVQDALVLRSSPAEGNEEWATVQLVLDDAQSRTLARAVAGEDHLTLTARSPGDAGARPIEPAKMSRKLGFETERASPKL